MTADELLYCALDPPGTGRIFFRIFNPTDEFIACDWRQIFPEAGNLLDFDERMGQIIRQVVDETARVFFDHTLDRTRVRQLYDRFGAIEAIVAQTVPDAAYDQKETFSLNQNLQFL